MVFRVTKKQKESIKFLCDFSNLSVEEIRQHESMKRPDGSFHRIETVRLWANRFKETGETNELPKSGRPKKLNSVQELKLLKFIKANC